MVTTGESIQMVTDRINNRVNEVLNRILRLGLLVATEKTDIVIFYNRGMKPKEDLFIRIGEDRVKIGNSFKYLGIMFDSRLNFVTHFQYVATKVSKIAQALNRLMPNLRGPGERKRRLYAFIVASVILYGAPIWSDELSKFNARTCLRELNRIWRTVAIRVISGYRTVSRDAACLLARLPPIHLLAEHRKSTYEEMKRLREEGTLTRDALKGIRTDADIRLRDK